MKISIIVIFIIANFLSCCKPEPKISRINYWYKTGFFTSVHGKMKLFSVDTIFEDGTIHTSKPETKLIYKIDSISRHREISTGESLSYAKSKYRVKRSMENTILSNDTLYYLSFTNVEHYLIYYDVLLSKNRGVYGFIYNSEDIIDGFDGLVFLQKSKIFVQSKFLISKLDSSFILDMFWKYNQEPDIF